MASARKTFKAKGNRRPNEPESAQYAGFISELLSGDVKATKLIETRDGQNRLTKLEYDDPNG